MRFKKRVIRILAYRILSLQFLVILLAGCGDDNKNPEFEDPMTSETLTKEALSLSWDLLEKGQAMADAGKSIEEILKILPDSTLVQTNAEAILYFIEGSVPMLIELPGDPNAPITKGSGRTVTPAAGNTALSALVTSFMVEADEEINVVAYEKGEEERDKKKALVLMPYNSQFGDYDDGLVAAEYLKENKNYEDRVEVLTSNLSLDTYASFSEYDLVHLSTHGTRFCNPALSADSIEIIEAGDSNFCRTLIDTGINDTISDADVYQYLMANEKYGKHIVLGMNTIRLKSTFFSEIFSTGPENKIWIFSGCELGQKSDLANSINATLVNGHFIYWLNSVYTSDAYPAFEKFYKNLIKEGLDAKKAFEEIPYESRAGLDSYVKVNNSSSSTSDGEIELFDPSDTPLQDSLNLTTALLHLQTGEPRHGIEVIEMYHPEEEDQRVRSGDFYPLVGDFGDGEDEALTLKVELKGYLRSEFEEEQMTLSLKVDDETVLDRRVFLPDVEDDEIEVEELEDQEYGVEVRVTDIAIPDVGDKEQITLKAYLHFDQERFSIHKEEVVIKADGIKAIVRGSGNTVTMTYDDKRRSLRMVTSGNQRTMYMDEAGYVYNYAPNRGWVKVNLGGVMGMIGQMPIGEEFTNSPIQGMLQPSNNNFFFPMVEWGIRFRMSAFERNPNFKKQEEECDKPEPCYRFRGIAGQEQGVSALFDPNGRLKELRYQGNTIKYEYGLFDVIIPPATEMKIGI